MVGKEGEGTLIGSTLKQMKVVTSSFPYKRIYCNVHFVSSECGSGLL